jgi:hypothetical protein
MTFTTRRAALLAATGLVAFSANAFTQTTTPFFRGRAAMRVALGQRRASPRGEPLIDQLPGGGLGEVEQVVDDAGRAGQARFLSRQLSLPVSTMSQ